MRQASWRLHGRFASALWRRTMMQDSWTTPVSDSAVPALRFDISAEPKWSARRKVWRSLLRGEDRLFRSMDELLALYDRAPNARLTVGSPSLEPIWDGSNLRPS